MEIPRVARRQRIHRGAQRAHRCREHPGDDQATEAAGHHVHHEVGKDPGVVRLAVRRQRQRRVIHHVSIIDRQQDADRQHSVGHRDVSESGEDGSHRALALVFRGEHPLDHILVGAVRREGDKERAEQGRPHGEFALQHALDISPRRAVAGDEFGGRRHVAIPLPELQVVSPGEVTFRPLPVTGDVA